MKIVHLPAIFEGGLRRAVLDYMAAPAELYDSLLWRCGRGDESPGGNERVFPLTVKPFNLSVPLLRSAWQGQVSSDIVHHHGCWSLTSMAALSLKKRHGLPLVYSPHGAFIPASLERYPRVKNAYLRIWERRVLQAVDCFHAVSEAEAESIRLMAGRRPIALIPNGIDLAQTPLRDIQPGFWRRWDIPEGSFKILFLSRVVADKGIDLLLRAMVQVLVHVPHAHCIVVGDGPEVYGAQLLQIVRDSGLTKDVTFIGPLKGEEKFSAYRNADVFVLPSRNEAQGIVVLEALSQNLPVVASRRTPYANLVKADCGWWEDNSPVALAAALARAAALSPQPLRTMGENGRNLLNEHYPLVRVHAELGELYAWVAGGMRSTDQPSSIV